MARRGLGWRSEGWRRTLGGEGGDPGAGITEEGQAVETRDRDSRRGASLQAGGASADLTACEEARRGWPG